MKRDPYWFALAAAWLPVPFTAIRYWLAWDQLPARMATHFDAQWQPNGWSSREDAMWMSFLLLGSALVVMTPACYLVRVRKPSHAWPVLFVTCVVVGFMTWGSTSILTRNLGD